MRIKGERRLVRLPIVFFVFKMKDLIEQILKMAKNESKMNEMTKDIVSKENKIKYLSENARQLNEILLVDTLKELDYKEKFETVMDIANYYVQHIEDKIIELDAPGKHI